MSTQDTPVTDEVIAKANKALQERIKQSKEVIHGAPTISRYRDSEAAWAAGYGMNVIAIDTIREIAEEFGLGAIRIFDALD